MSAITFDYNENTIQELNFDEIDFVNGAGSKHDFIVFAFATIGGVAGGVAGGPAGAVLGAGLGWVVGEFVSHATGHS